MAGGGVFESAVVGAADPPHRPEEGVFLSLGSVVRGADSVDGLRPSSPEGSAAVSLLMGAVVGVAIVAVAKGVGAGGSTSAVVATAVLEAATIGAAVVAGAKVAVVAVTGSAVVGVAELLGKLDEGTAFPEVPPTRGQLPSPLFAKVWVHHHKLPSLYTPTAT